MTRAIGTGSSANKGSLYSGYRSDDRPATVTRRRQRRVSSAARSPTTSACGFSMNPKLVRSPAVSSWTSRTARRTTSSSGWSSMGRLAAKSVSGARAGSGRRRSSSSLPNTGGKAYRYRAGEVLDGDRPFRFRFALRVGQVVQNVHGRSSSGGSVSRCHFTDTRRWDRFPAASSMGRSVRYRPRAAARGSEPYN